MERLKRRADFVAAASGRKAPAAGFVVQVRHRGGRGASRVGFTVSKRVGNAVERNRIRRRLREVLRLSGGAFMTEGHDYVLIGRREALRLPFERLTRDFSQALNRVHAAAKPTGA
jgi:ribonuclease P protein component